MGSSAIMEVNEEARKAGLAWEKFSNPSHISPLEIHADDGLEEIFYLGPHRSTSDEEGDRPSAQTVVALCTQFTLRKSTITTSFTSPSTELNDEIARGEEPEALGRLRDHIAEIKSRRITQH